MFSTKLMGSGIEMVKINLRLKKILLGRRPGVGGGFITRTAAESDCSLLIAARR